MKRRAVWGTQLAVLVTTAGLGCGLQDAHSSNPSASPAPTATSVSAPAAETSPADNTPAAPPAEASPASDGWQVTPAPTPITFEVPACVPVSPPTGTRHAHPCSVKRYGPDGSPIDLQYLDEQGRDIGLFQYAQGVLSGGYRLTYDAQGQPLHKDFYAGDRTTPGASIDWLYDAAGRPVLLTGNGLPQERYSQYDSLGSPVYFTYAGGYQERHLYDDQGRLFRVEHFDSPQFISHWESYLYNAQGQLGEIVYSSQDYCYSGPRDLETGCGVYSTRTFTYHPNGQIDHDQFLEIQNYSSTWDNEYDDQGRPISAGDSFSESGTTTTWTYDARGQRVQAHLFQGSSSGTWEQWTAWLYDDAGQPGARRITSNSIWSDPPITRHEVNITRSFHACESGLLLFEEQDTNEDGVRDGSHELTWDAAGNLLVETYHGAFVQEVYLSRVEYDYSCYP